MAGASLLTLIDAIATILDDVAVMTKVAAKKTDGVLGDALALNAQQVTGVRALSNPATDMVSFERGKIGWARLPRSWWAAASLATV